jgi:hypothetical protein
MRDKYDPPGIIMGIDWSKNEREAHELTLEANRKWW